MLRADEGVLGRRPRHPAGHELLVLRLDTRLLVLLGAQLPRGVLGGLPLRFLALKDPIDCARMRGALVVHIGWKERRSRESGGGRHAPL
jgi:hypothetical protein